MEGGRGGGEGMVRFAVGGILTGHRARVNLRFQANPRVWSQAHQTTAVPQHTPLVLLRRGNEFVRQRHEVVPGAMGGGERATAVRCSSSQGEAGGRFEGRAGDRGSTARTK